MAFVKFVLFKKPGKLTEDGTEKPVGLAELNGFPVPEGAELIDAFAGKLNEKLEALLDGLLPALEVVA